MSIAYVDPLSPIKHRKQVFSSFGFECTCPLCKDQAEMARSSLAKYLPAPEELTDPKVVLDKYELCKQKFATQLQQKGFIQDLHMLAINTMRAHIEVMKVAVEM